MLLWYNTENKLEKILSKTVKKGETMEDINITKEWFLNTPGVVEYIYQKNEGIALSSEKLERIYFVLEGEVDINFISENGNVMHLVTAKKGELLGSPDFYFEQWEVNMTAKTKVKLLGIKKDDASALDKDYLFWKAMYMDVVQKLEAFAKRMFIKSTAISHENYFLLYLKEKDYQVEFKSLADLSYCLNLDYRNFYRVVTKLADIGIIAKEKNKIYVPDIDKFNLYLSDRF